MRSLLLTEIFPPRHGGSGRWFWEIYRRVSRHEVLVAAGEHPEQAAFDAQHEMNVQRIKLHMTQWGLRSRIGLAGYWRSVRTVGRLARDWQARVVHCGRVLPEGWVAWLLKARFALPYICYVHGEDVQTAKRSRELAWMCRRVLFGAAAIIANSQNTRRILVDEWKLPTGKVRVLYPGADTQYFVPAPASDTERASLGWQGRAVVLTVGRLEERKGQDMLIRALGELRHAVPNVLYSVVGGGPDRQRLERLVEETGVRDLVEFRGEPNDAELVRCYQQCDLFALPNRTVGDDIEGFGMVLVEAQACGKPIIAGDSGGTVETMRPGDTGRIVDCTRPGPLAQAVVELLCDQEQCQAMGRAGRKWAVEQFDWESLARRAHQVFELS